MNFPEAIGGAPFRPGRACIPHSLSIQSRRQSRVGAAQACIDMVFAYDRGLVPAIALKAAVVDLVMACREEAPDDHC